MKKLKLFSIILTMLVLSACSSDKDFEKGKIQLENQGYRNIEKTGHSYFCCGEKDSFSTGFMAVDNTGRTVTGCFCSGILKGITIRFE